MADGTAEDLARRIEDAPAWEPSTKDAPPAATEANGKTSRLVIRTMSGVEPKETDWLWKRWLARGKLGLLAGSLETARARSWRRLRPWSVGGTWPDGTQAPHFRTLFLLGEDALDDTLRPRLDLHGADADQVFAIETVLDDDGHDRFFNVEKHFPCWRTPSATTGSISSSSIP